MVMVMFGGAGEREEYDERRKEKRGGSPIFYQ